MRTTRNMATQTLGSKGRYMKLRFILNCVTSGFAMILLGCDQTKSTSHMNTTYNVEPYIEIIQPKRIYFGHMSVGQNIIQGIEELMTSGSKSQLTLINKETAESLPESFFLHSGVGENTKPLSKCIDYENIINNELKGKIDYALLKFCYIDINNDTDIDNLFTKYTQIMDRLINANPEITFIHVTVPLRHSENGIVVWIHELVGSVLGKENMSKLANIKRNEFNNRLLEKYKNSPIFDLAASESTYPDGKKESFQYKNHKSKFYNLIGSYTNDGGHLNEIGRKKVANDFLEFLANTIKSS
ncbi:MAG: hypothetical protein OQL06_12480 [Gammaproteobacteria bacterium]|nr:hypothetical protein [Gammaproteobacteria bacterium]